MICRIRHYPTIRATPRLCSGCRPLRLAPDLKVRQVPTVRNRNVMTTISPVKRRPSRTIRAGCSGGGQNPGRRVRLAGWACSTPCLAGQSLRHLRARGQRRPAGLRLPCLPLTLNEGPEAVGRPHIISFHILYFSVRQAAECRRSRHLSSARSCCMVSTTRRRLRARAVGPKIRGKRVRPEKNMIS
jgi:hypothetical protein